MEHAGNDPFARARSDRWIIFLFFMMVFVYRCSPAQPAYNSQAIVMIYYYRRYTPTTKGSIWVLWSAVLSPA